ncbi:MAG TPA: M28 family peptidase, partial [Blastocatellia bacterium]|nr:M28 family peptidase [Blastocatellia bacterium]
MFRLRKVTVILTQMALVAAFAVTPAATETNGDRERINAQELEEWLTYFSSDEFEGRATFSEGLGLAAGYIAGQLKSWGVKPGGPNGSYFQRVAVLGVKSENRSTITVEVNGQTRTFKHREGVTFPSNVGSKRSFTADKVEFLGYGLYAPGANHNDYDGKDVKGKVVVYLGAGPKGLNPQFRRVLSSRSRYAIDQGGGIAAIGPPNTFGGRRGQQPAGPGQTPAPDFTTAQRLDNVIAPSVTGSDEFFEFLFSGSDVKYAELKAKSSNGEPLPAFSLKNVKLTFNLDADYTVVRTQYTRNVVGIIEGTDARLKDTYVAYGSHYDHVGYSEGELVQGDNGPRRLQARGRVTRGAEDDRIWNGADDDGSGSVTMLAIAKAFAMGRKPRRSLLFVWHAGEERGLWGSRYFADYPTVPLDKIVAEINMDMVGRNRDNKQEEANTVYVVGSDRISTEFHNITVDANKALARPLKLDYELNDPTDLEQIYYRSDHYSYAAKGIPIVFLTTGLHPDYHA